MGENEGISTGVQKDHPVAIYARVSTALQDCERQVDELNAFAVRAGLDVVAVPEAVHDHSGCAAECCARKARLAIGRAAPYRGNRWLPRRAPDQALVMISTNSLRTGAKNGVSACHHHMFPST